MTIVRLHLRGADEPGLIRLLRRLLKVLGRTYRVRCQSITVESTTTAPPLGHEPKEAPCPSRT